MQGPSSIQGLDHVVVAVSDLDVTSRRYEQLGFSLTPGQAHANGIRNQHVKFQNGTQLELGDGPTRAGFFAADRARLNDTLTSLKLPVATDGDLTTFPDRHPLHYLFFGSRRASPTDRPEHFAHRNGARALISLWLAVDDGNVRALMTSLGVPFETIPVELPNTPQAVRGALPEGDILLLPHNRQVVPGHPIAGMTLRIDSLNAARASLATLPVAISGSLIWRENAVFIPPAVTQGLWIELRETG